MPPDALQAHEGRRPARQQVREDVLDAAGEVFLEHGFRGATIEGIAQRAGYSKGAVYSNFESKTDLFLALLVDRTLVRAGRHAVLEADSEAPSLAEGVSLEERCDRAALAVARAVVAVAEEGRPAIVLAEFRAFAATDPAARERVGGQRHDVVESLTRWLEEGLRDRDIRACVPVEDIATLVLGLIQGLAVQRAGPEDALVQAATISQGLRGLIAPVSA